MKVKKKTHSGAKKRFEVTKHGNIKFSQTKRRKNLTKKSSRVKRFLRQSAYISTCDKRHIKNILG